MATSLRGGISWAVAASLALALGACGRTPQGSAAPQLGAKLQGLVAQAKARRQAERGGRWTILLHMSADNNLAPFGPEDLDELSAGLPEDGSIQALVLFDGDRHGDSAVLRLRPNQVPELVEGTGLIPDSGEIDSGSAAVAEAFVRWGAKAAPADHTMLVYWNHGSGIWARQHAPKALGRSWGNDDEQKSHMVTADLSRLSGAFKAVAGKPLAILGFDACLMAHAEHAHQLIGGANYLVASQELEPAKGWDYYGWMQAVTKLPVAQRTPGAVGAALVDTYVASYEPGGSQHQGKPEATLSCVDVGTFAQGMMPLLNAFAAEGVARLKAQPELKAPLQAHRNASQGFANLDTKDLGDFLGRIQADAAWDTKTLKQLREAYEASIPREGHSQSRPKATGMCIYLPKDIYFYPPSYDDPNQFSFARSQWKDFLKAMK